MTVQSARSKTYALTDATPTWFPAATALTGTLSSANTRVTGTGTAFKTQISVGNYLVNASNIARKVHSVESDTVLILEEPFTADLSGETCRRVENQLLRHLKLVFITNAGTMKCASQDTPAAVPAGFVWELPHTLAAYHEPQLVTPGAAGATVIETL